MLEGSRPDERVLPAVVIYGANASGKTNVIAAMNRMRTAVLYSHSRGSPTGDLLYTPFLLSDEGQNSPSQFDCDLIVEGTRYHYGFSQTEHRFEKEWLYAFPSGKRQLWYSRGPDEGQIKFGKYLKGQNRSIAGFMRQNSLFLSTAAQNSHSQPLPLYDFFQKRFLIMMSPDVLGLQHELSKINQRIIDFLRQADTGITSWRVEKQEVTEEGKKFGDDLHALLSTLPIELPPPDPI